VLQQQLLLRVGGWQDDRTVLCWVCSFISLLLPGDGWVRHQWLLLLLLIAAVQFQKDSADCYCGRLLGQCCQVSPHKTGSAPGNGAKVKPPLEPQVPSEHPQDLLPRCFCWYAQRNLPVKAPSTSEGRVQRVWPVSGTHHHNVASLLLLLLLLFSGCFLTGFSHRCCCGAATVTGCCRWLWRR
jgi:hypothetical protein